jgi:hypothetical protein
MDTVAHELRSDKDSDPSSECLFFRAIACAVVFKLGTIFDDDLSPGFPGGFPPPPDPSSANVRFILESKSSLDANAILDKLKNKLKVGNHQMSYSGNNATITFGIAGPFEDAIKAVDFGKVTKKDQATRTINVGIP